jgi:hypothetical protein
MQGVFGRTDSVGVPVSSYSGIGSFKMRFGVNYQIPGLDMALASVLADRNCGCAKHAPALFLLHENNGSQILALPFRTQ